MVFRRLLRNFRRVQRRKEFLRITARLQDLEQKTPRYHTSPVHHMDLVSEFGAYRGIIHTFTLTKPVDSPSDIYSLDDLAFLGNAFGCETTFDRVCSQATYRTVLRKFDMRLSGWLRINLPNGDEIHYRECADIYSLEKHSFPDDNPLLLASFNIHTDTDIRMNAIPICELEKTVSTYPTSTGFQPDSRIVRPLFAQSHPHIRDLAENCFGPYGAPSFFY